MMNAETSKRRLMLVVEKLRSLPADRFDYSEWVGQDWKGAKDLSCGTTACALGWATTVPELAEAGLYLRFFDYDYAFVSIKGDDIPGPMSAAMTVFGVTNYEAHFLFVPGYDKGVPDDDATPSQVADHIERFIQRKWGDK